MRSLPKESYIGNIAEQSTFQPKHRLIICIVVLILPGTITGVLIVETSHDTTD
jgi:hypothetical protein